MIYLLLEATRQRAAADRRHGARDRGRRPRHVAATPTAAGAIAGERGELCFAPGDAVADERGRRWDVDGELDALLGDGRRTACCSPSTTPTRCARVWAALSCPTSGDVLLSAEPAYEFPDWGERAHVRGGSHGSLHRVDSLGALLFCGVDCPPERDARPVVDRRRRADGARPLRRRWRRRLAATSLSGDDRRGLRGAGRRSATPPAQAHARARRPAHAGELAAAGPLRRRSARAATSSTSPSSRLPCTARGSTTGFAATLAFIVALANNFFWNRGWTFRAGDGHAGFQAARFIVVSLVAFGFNLLVLFALVEFGGVGGGARAGDRDRRGDAAELPRQQALELQDVKRAACCAAFLIVLLATAGGPQPRRSAATTDRRRACPARRCAPTRRAPRRAADVAPPAGA